MSRAHRSIYDNIINSIPSVHLEQFVIPLSYTVSLSRTLSRNWLKSLSMETVSCLYFLIFFSFPFLFYLTPSLKSISVVNTPPGPKSPCNEFTQIRVHFIRYKHETESLMLFCVIEKQIWLLQPLSHEGVNFWTRFWKLNFKLAHCWRWYRWCPSFPVLLCIPHSTICHCHFFGVYRSRSCLYICEEEGNDIWKISARGIESSDP